MRDSTKFALILGFSLLFIGYFLGKGLTVDNYQFFLSRRIPKVLAIVLAGMAIAASSLVFQTVTNNRILTPSILGFDALYIMIQVILVASFGGLSLWITNAKVNFVLSTAIMAVLATFLFGLYFKRQRTNIFTLLLIGVVCGSLFNSVTGFFTMVIDPDEFIAIQNSMFASFNNVSSELVYWCTLPLLACIAYLYRYASQLDVLWLGVDNAKSLGVDTAKLTKKIMFVTTLLVSISTALVGPVLFLGLIVVSLTRQIFTGFQHRFLIASSCVVSIALLISGQWLVEHLLDFQTTISVIINFVGGSYFLSLLVRNKIS
ncbi:iron chelate uptake ABC transporter family permease subunit [Vibrio superstes]|uniref:ABC transporter permease n=1 Tax=Vibrio superstes NBRC 103154 TaxID=1219062 RepID=A0A511QT66_9VIBR|nr:iron chelate uptake ABC transporter family permease subunit [Vibrio superstes]GEM80540.1 ABC transporter permease [Vibrio superstes NBRC 103154]